MNFKFTHYGRTRKSRVLKRISVLAVVFTICLELSAVEPETQRDQDKTETAMSQSKLYRVLDTQPSAQPPPNKIKSQNSKSTFIIESGAISFSDVIPGQDKDLPGCIAVRVFSNDHWRLKVVATSPLQILDHTDLAPIYRLRIRSGFTGGFVPFEEARAILLAEGMLTNPSGQLVIADLRLRLENEDSVGVYSSNFRIILEVD